MQYRLQNNVWREKGGGGGEVWSSGDALMKYGKHTALKLCGKWSKLQKYNKSPVMKYSTSSPHITEKLCVKCTVLHSNSRRVVRNSTKVCSSETWNVLLFLRLKCLSQQQGSFEMYA